MPVVIDTHIQIEDDCCIITLECDECGYRWSFKDYDSDEEVADASIIAAAKKCPKCKSNQW